MIDFSFTLWCVNKSMKTWYVAAVACCFTRLLVYLFIRYSKWCGDLSFLLNITSINCLVSISIIFHVMLKCDSFCLQSQDIASRGCNYTTIQHTRRKKKTFISQTDFILIWQCSLQLNNTNIVFNSTIKVTKVQVFWNNVMKRK